MLPGPFGRGPVRCRCITGLSAGTIGPSLDSWLASLYGMNTEPSNIFWHQPVVTRGMREARNGHRSSVVWFTGLSGSGKSTLAHAVEGRLHERNIRTFVFDGDNVRHGLCGDLGFSIDDRTENIRRIGQMSKLFVDAGIIALTAFISPFRVDRQRVRMMVDEDADFLEVWCRCPLEVCESRDVKGLYQRARKGEISDFTGISSPYEEPENAHLIVDTDECTVEESVEQVVNMLVEKGIVPKAA